MASASCVAGSRSSASIAAPSDAGSAARALREGQRLGVLASPARPLATSAAALVSLWSTYGRSTRSTSSAVILRSAPRPRNRGTASITAGASAAPSGAAAAERLDVGDAVECDKQLDLISSASVDSAAPGARPKGRERLLAGAPAARSRSRGKQLLVLGPRRVEHQLVGCPAGPRAIWISPSSS
jgi:hypothetical protein